MSSNWVGIAISVLVMLGGTAVNLFIIGRFVGQWSEAMKNIASTLQKVEAQAEAVQDQADGTDGRLQLIDQRLGVAEAATAKFWEMRDAFTRMTVTIESEGKHSREKLESLARGQSVIERQLANLVSAKGGFTVISTDGQ
jgi:hypothetical protein